MTYLPKVHYSHPVVCGVNECVCVYGGGVVDTEYFVLICIMSSPSPSPSSSPSSSPSPSPSSSPSSSQRYTTPSSAASHARSNPKTK